MDPSTLQAHSPRPGSIEELHQSLNTLSQRAIQANVKELDQVLDLARGFKAWTERVRFLGTDWWENHDQQAQAFIDQLQSDVPVAQVMERLLRLLLLTHRMLEKEKKILAPRREKETDAPPPFRRLSPRRAEPARKSAPLTGIPQGQMGLRSEDLGFFQIFLLEVPPLLEEVRDRLAETNPAKKNDLASLDRSLRDLKSRFGFLGFLGAWRLGLETERLLTPLIGSGSPMSEELRDGLSQILSFWRAQADQVEEGLPSLSVQPLDPAGLLEKLRAIPTPPPPRDAEETLRLEPEPGPDFSAQGLQERIRTQQLDGLFENLADLVMAQNRILEDYRPNAKPQGLSEVARLQKASLRLRDEVLSLGMTPLGPLLSQGYQLASALGRKKNLTLEVRVEGAEVEMDQRLLPELKKPLFHLIQNSLDHGLESPRDRRALGKKGEGRLTLKACSKDGAILLEVEDDGRGLDPEKIRRRADELGWKVDENLPASRLVELVFRPGFSAQALHSAGKETGLDTVRQKMESLLGSVRVKSQPGQGCKFTLKVPRSLALMDGWVVRAGGQNYLVPVAQTIKIEPAGRPVPAGEGEEVPELDLAIRLGGEKDRPEGKLSVRVEAGSLQVRLRVEDVTGKQQVLVKNNKEGFSFSPGVRAEALLADGSTGWILDIASLLRVEKGEKPLKGINHGNQADGGL